MKKIVIFANDIKLPRLVMKNKVYLLIATLAFLFSALCDLNAKPDKIKYNKYLVYEGEVIDNNPVNHGVLTCIDPRQKDAPLIRIEGDFNGNVISNASAISNGMSGLSFEGVISYNLDCLDKDSVSFSLIFGYQNTGTFSHDNIKIISDSQPNIKVRNIPMHFSFNKNDKCWIVTYGENGESTYRTFALVNNTQFPACVNKFNYTESQIKGISCCVEISRDSIVSIDKSCTFVFDDLTSYCDGKLSFGTGGCYTVLDDSWYGSHRLIDGTYITRLENGDFRFEYTNGDIYEGSIICDDITNAFGRAASLNSFTYYSGILHKDSIKTIWIEGETFDKRHERFLSLYDEDLVDSLESNLVTKEYCDTTMAYRVEMRRQEAERLRLREEAMSKLDYSAILFRHWKNKKGVQLEGIVKSWNLEIIPNAESLDSNLFEGTISLSLQSDRVALFNLKVNPSKDSKNIGGDTMEKVTAVCDALTQQIIAKWGLDGMSILLDNKEVGLEFSKDGKSVMYNGVATGTMGVQRSSVTKSKSK